MKRLSVIPALLVAASGCSSLEDNNNDTLSDELRGEDIRRDTKKILDGFADCVHNVLRHDIEESSVEEGYIGVEGGHSVIVCSAKACDCREGDFSARLSVEEDDDGSGRIDSGVTHKNQSD